jgi:hypothetical protein
MHVKPNLGSDWRKGAIDFLKWMRERGWRRTWLASGQRFTCVGVVGMYQLADNDNEPTT